MNLYDGDEVRAAVAGRGARAELDKRWAEKAWEAWLSGDRSAWLCGMSGMCPACYRIGIVERARYVGVALGRTAQIHRTAW